MDYTIYEDEYEGTFRTYTGEHVVVSIQEMDNGYGYVRRIDVDEGFRGQGIGTSAIMEVLEDYDGLYFAPDNERASHLYARLGEKVIGDGWMTARPIPEVLTYLDQGYGIYEVA